MAPEQLAGDPDADSRADIYAAGLLAYELLTGRAAFSGASPRETMAAQLTSQPRRIEELRADVPPALAALIGRCLAKDPAQRPESAGAVLAELDRAVSDMSGSIAIPAQSARAGRIRRSARAFGAFAAVLLLVVFAYRAGRERRAATRQRAAVTPQQDSFSGMARGSAAASADTFTMAELRALIEQAVNARLEGKGAGAVAPSAGAGAAAAVSASVSGSDSVRFRVYEESLRTFLRDSLIAAAPRSASACVRPRSPCAPPPAWRPLSGSPK
jgi:serine/threonine-protein kinase